MLDRSHLAGIPTEIATIDSPGMAFAAAPTMSSASFTTPGECSPTVPAGGSAITATVVGGAGGACSVAAGQGDLRRSTDGH
jgi:hypothetical protein